MPHREVTLTMAEVQRYEAIRATVEGRLTGEETAKALGLSRRQVERLKAKVRTEGTAGVRHGNAGRGPWNKTPDGLRRRIIDLATGEYAAYNFSHLADTLAEDRDIHRSDETLRQWLRPLGHGRPRRRAKVHRLRRRRQDHEGEWLFLDGSPHAWFGPDHESVCLLLATDDATGKPLRGKFQPHEDRDGCFEVCYHVFLEFGLNGLWYLDRASQFKTTRHGGLHVAQRLQQDDTPFQQAMQRLAVGVQFAHSPQARGRGERINGSFQGRLVAELMHEGITDCPTATGYLNRSFIPRYAKRFGRTPADPKHAWRPVPDGLDLRTVLCVRHQRTVANDNTLSLDGVAYQLLPPAGRHPLAHAVVEVQQWFDQSVHCVHPRYGEVRLKGIP
ncbi:MAG: ISNCY family transposase [Planctomycetota bacterium]|nr:ISNCY family transposase [Planctomycetota bacterium]